MKHKSTVFYIKIILALLMSAALLASFYIYLVYNGYCQLNHPSKTKYPVRGVDVSHYQGDIDWNVLSQENIRFAYIKATEGSSHVDNRFAKNWQAARETDLAVGAYHFFSFDSPGESQAANFIQCVEQATVSERSTQAETAEQTAVLSMLPPVVDVEYYGDKKINPPVPEAVQTELQTFLNLIEDHYGKTPVIYSTEEVWDRYLKGHFDSYPLWIRNVYTYPANDADWTFWQYSNRHRLQGYSGEEVYIDMNVFCGSLEEWNRWVQN